MINERTRPLTDREWAEHLTRCAMTLVGLGRPGFELIGFTPLTEKRESESEERNRLQGES